MKILLLIQKPQLRGAEIFACQLGNHLAEAGHEVLLVSLLPGDAELPFTGKHVSLNRPLSKRLWDYAGWKLLAEHIRAFRPDVVQANAGDTLKFAVFSKLVYRWKTPLVFRNANKVSDFVNTTPKLLYNKFLVSNVQHTISVSELCRQDFSKTYSVAPARTTTVPIGIDCKPVNRCMPPDLASFFSSGNVLVHVAGFVPEKNHNGLIRIVHKLTQQGEDVKILLIGEGRLRPAIEQQVLALTLNERVKFAGHRSDVLSVMANARALVLPSLIEGLPAVILEAMYVKTPVVAYDVGGISEVVKSGETGWLVTRHDEEGFTGAVTRVLRGSDTGPITENAYRLVITGFDNRIISKRFEEVYRSVAQASRRQSGTD